MAAVRAHGHTVIENAAMEPEIADLADSLNKMGSKINITNKGIIKITGVKKLTKANHKILSDRIVAGTFIIAAVMLNKKFKVNSNKHNLLAGLKYLNFENRLKLSNNFSKKFKINGVFKILKIINGTI